MSNPEIIKEAEKYKIHDFESAKEFLFERLADSETKLFGRERGIARTEAWLEELGKPQEQFPSIHIAGTSGKGSTAYMIDAILTATGATTGTITSPHVYDVRERMLINGRYISDHEFTNRTQDIVTPIAKLEKTPLGRPTYFEVMVGMAHQIFADHHVDYGIIETGIGGRFDSTNTIQRPDKLAVITQLGLDHTEILGHKLEEIAWQKAGIIQENGHAIVQKPASTQVKNVIKDVCVSRNATVEFVDPAVRAKNIRQTPARIVFDYKSRSLHIKDIAIPTLGTYQAANATMAIATLEYLAKRDIIDITEQAIRAGLEHVSIPARAEIVDFHGTPVIIDAAHNPQKLEAFFSLLESLKLPTKPLVIFAAKSTKDWEASANIVANHADSVLVTDFFASQTAHLKRYSADPHKIARQIQQAGTQAKTFVHPFEALEHALESAQAGQAIIITGSMYMLGELHDHIRRLA